MIRTIMRELQLLSLMMVLVAGGISISKLRHPDTFTLTDILKAENSEDLSPRELEYLLQNLAESESFPFGFFAEEFTENLYKMITGGTSKGNFEIDGNAMLVISNMTLKIANQNGEEIIVDINRNYGSPEIFDFISKVHLPTGDDFSTQEFDWESFQPSTLLESNTLYYEVFNLPESDPLSRWFSNNISIRNPEFGDKVSCRILKKYEMDSRGHKTEVLSIAFFPTSLFPEWYDEVYRAVLAEIKPRRLEEGEELGEGKYEVTILNPQYWNIAPDELGMFEREVRDHIDNFGICGIRPDRSEEGSEIVSNLNGMRG